MCLFAVAVGIIAGIGAWLFRVLIGLCHNLLFLGQFSIHYDANVHTPPSPWGICIILVPMLGSVAVVWLVKTFAPEAKGHGVPEVIDAIYYQGGRIRPVVAGVKSLASAICIGSGGSVGREGPIIQIGSAFGSTLGQVFNLPTRQCITLIAAGGAGGIAATFNAPLGGLVFAVELLLVTINAKTLLPVGLATVIASYIGRIMIGTHPAFDLEILQVPNFHLTHPALMALLLPFGVVMGLVSVLFVRGIYWAEDLFESLGVNDYVRHMIGMAAVGVMIYLLQRQAGHYYVQGVGYATIMDLLSGSLTDFRFLLLLFVLKFVATCCTLGSGGSGGVFSPALYMGATTGAMFSILAQRALPGIEVSAVPFVLAGMAAGVGGTTGAIITGSVMLLEMTDDVNVALPIIVTSVTACGIRRWLSNESIYTLKLMRRGHIVPQGLSSSLLESHRATDVMQNNFRILEKDQLANRTDVMDSYEGTTIVADNGSVIGVASRENHSEIDQRYLIAITSLPLFEVLRQMHDAKADYALIVETCFEEATESIAEEIVGVITHRELVALQFRTAELT